MGLFDGLGEHDSPQRRAAVKRQQAAMLQEQIAERERKRGYSDVHSKQPSAQPSAQPGRGVPPQSFPLPLSWPSSNIPPAPQPAAAPAPNWPWQMGMVPPLQAWRSPPAAAINPHSFFPRPQVQAGWNIPQSADMGLGLDVHNAAGRMPQPHMNLKGAGRGVARPVSSAKGGWLAPQMRSSLDDLIYGHDLDGYEAPGAGTPGAPPARAAYIVAAPAPTAEQPTSAARRRPASSGPRIDIDAEWAVWEAENPLRRRRRVDPNSPLENRSNIDAGPSAPPAAAPKDSARNKQSNKPVVDIDAEWAEWESKHPEFKKRNKHREGAPVQGQQDRQVGNQTQPMPGANQQTPRDLVTHEQSSPSKPVSPASPPRPPRPALPDAPHFSVRPQPPDGIRFGGKSRISEDMRGISVPSLSDELRTIRRSCSNQRELLHSQVEKLKNEASRLLLEEANVPKLVLSKQNLLQKPLMSNLHLIQSSHHDAHSPLLRLLEEQRRLALERPNVAASAMQLGVWRPQGGAANNIDLRHAGIPPELALAELRLAAVEAENRRRAVLPSLPDYPVVLGTADPHKSMKLEGTLQDDSDLVWPDAFNATRGLPALEASPSKNKGTTPEKLKKGIIETSPSELSPGSVEAAASEAADAVVRSAIASARHGATQVNADGNRSDSTSAKLSRLPSLDFRTIDYNHLSPHTNVTAPGDAGPSVLQKSADLDSLVFSASGDISNRSLLDPLSPQQSTLLKSKSKDTAGDAGGSKLLKSADLDSLAYSVTGDVSHRSSSDVPSSQPTSPPQPTPFSQVIDLGAALRKGRDCDAIDEDGDGADDAEKYDATALPPDGGAGNATTVTDRTASPVNNATGGTERTASPVADRTASLSPTDGQDSLGQHTSPRQASPRPPRPDGDDAAAAAHARRNQDEEGNGVKQTQDLLRSVLINDSDSPAPKELPR